MGADPTVAASEFVSTLTNDELLWCVDGDAPMWAGLEMLGRGGYHDAPFTAARVPRLGFPGFSFSDGPRGVVIGNATCFPVSMARGATWDPDLEERIGVAIGKELRARGANLFGGVCVNLLRHPAWGRSQETYGEDPHHVGVLGAALTRGVQRHAMATVKHFAVNSMENARFRVDVQIDDVALHEVFLPHFRRIVDEGVACVMSAYNQVNGSYCGEHRELLTDILRGEWNFQGFVISDWIYGLRDAAASIDAGLDVEMPYRMVRAMHLSQAIDDGSVSRDDVRTAVERVVATVLRFDHILSSPIASIEDIDASEHIALARTAAAQSIVLLKNESVGDRPLLPLDATRRQSIAVIGRLSDTVNLGDGGSSDVYSIDNVTVLEGLHSAAPNADIVHCDGSDETEAITLARSADTVVLVVGYTLEDEGEFIGDPGIDLRHLLPPKDDDHLVEQFRSEVRTPTIRPDHVLGRRGLGFAVGGDRTSLTLRAEDEDLIRAVSSVNDRTIVVIQAGSAVVMTSWVESVPCVLQAWYGGQQAGHAVADIVFGSVNPSGRLPFTVPVDAAHLPHFDRDADSIVYDRWHGWWRAEHLGLEPLFPFGHGLSYTTFVMEGSVLTRTDDGYRITCNLTNTGPCTGADVVQVYARYSDPSVPRRLVGFQRVHLEPAETATVVIDVATGELLQRHPTEKRWVHPPEPVRLTITRHGVGVDEVALHPASPT
ncbi:MAG: beta-glucosidase [Actinomycetota bacterium]